MSRPGSEPASGRGAAPIRVCLDARLVSGEFGGVEQVIIGLADGLSRLVDSPDEYMFLVNRGHEDWLRRYVSGPCRLLVSDRSGPGGRGNRVTRQGARMVRRLKRIAGRAAVGRALALAPADGAVERAGADVMHFTMQIGFRTAIPSIYQPWDLQHLHLPEFFAPETIANREFTYRALCDQAATVVVMSRWIKRDFVEKYSLPEDKVRVVPLAPIIDAYRKPSPGDLAEARARFVSLRRSPSTRPRPGRTRTTSGCWRRLRFSGTSMGWWSPSSSPVLRTASGSPCGKRLPRSGFGADDLHWLRG